MASGSSGTSQSRGRKLGAFAEALDGVIDVDALNSDHEDAEPTPPISSEQRQRPKLALRPPPRVPTESPASSPERPGSNLAMVGGRHARMPSQLIKRQQQALNGRNSNVLTISSDTESDEDEENKKHLVYKKKHEQAAAKAEAASKRELPPPAPPVAAPVVQPPAAPVAPVVTETQVAPVPLTLPSENESICLGAIHAPLLCMSGLPEQILFDQTSIGHGHKELEDLDPAYDKSMWPSQTMFWAEKGYRPAVLQMVPEQIHAQIIQAEQAKGGVNLLTALSRAQEIKVSLVIPPALQTPQPGGSSALQKRAPFGVIAEKYCGALDPLLRSRKLKLESRVALAPRYQAKNYMHQIEMLAFTTRKYKDQIANSLLSHQVTLLPPDTYNSADYEGKPTYENPHAGNPSVLSGPLAASFRRSGPGAAILPEGAEADAHMTEQEKKDQVDSVYSSLTHAEEVEQVVPSPLIKTNLFPHQRQALAFLLMREKDRTFESVMAKMKEKQDKIAKLKRKQMEKKRRAENGESEPDPDATAEEGEGDEETKQFADAEDRAEEDGGTVSLWKPVKNSVGGIKSYLNVVTNSQVRERPEICRGAILADDMGLGKTISVIALLAHTREDATIYGNKPPTGKTSKAVLASRAGGSGANKIMLSDSSDDDLEYAGMGQAKRGKGKGKKKAADSQASGSAAKKAKTASDYASKPAVKLTRKEKARQIQETRIANLDTRSRATLIVCPMSIISNWVSRLFGPHTQRVFLTFSFVNRRSRSTLTGAPTNAPKSTSTTDHSATRIPCSSRITTLSLQPIRLSPLNSPTRPFGKIRRSKRTTRATTTPITPVQMSRIWTCLSLMLRGRLLPLPSERSKRGARRRRRSPVEIRPTHFSALSGSEWCSTKRTSSKIPRLGSQWLSAIFRLNDELRSQERQFRTKLTISMPSCASSA